MTRAEEDDRYVWLADGPTNADDWIWFNRATQLSKGQTENAPLEPPAFLLKDCDRDQDEPDQYGREK